MTDHPDPVAPDDQSEQSEQSEPAGHVEPAGPSKPSRRRVRRRAERAGTNPSADDGPDVVPPRAEPKPGESQHDRWLREQRPPHWE